MTTTTPIETLRREAILAARTIPLIRAQYRNARPGKEREDVVADHLARPWIEEWQVELVREDL